MRSLFSDDGGDDWPFMQDLSDDGFEDITLKCITLASIPAITMLLGGLTVLAPSSPPRRLVYAMQHFAAGMLLCSIAQELVPPLTKAKSAPSILGLLVGFALGVLLMISLEAFVGEHDQDTNSLTEVMLQPGEGTVTPSATDDEGAIVTPERPSMETPSGRRSPADEPIPAQKLSSAIKRAYTIRERMRNLATPSFPWVFATAVYVDSVMDGLLIGVAIITGNRAGLTMALALCVEMGFLGVTFAQSVAPQPRPRALLAVFGAPLCLLLGALVGGLLTHTLSSNPAALVGCTAFGVSALMYMVCEELLVSAHEAGEDHVWWIDLQVYVGFLFSLLLEKALDLFHQPS